VLITSNLKVPAPSLCYLLPTDPLLSTSKVPAPNLVPVTSQIHFHPNQQCLHCKNACPYQQLCINHIMTSPTTAGSQMTPKVTYAMSPGQVVQKLSNYSTNTGMKQWIKATKPLDDKPYDGSSKGLSHFLSKLSQRALDSGWGSIT